VTFQQRLGEEEALGMSTRGKRWMITKKIDVQGDMRNLHPPTLRSIVLISNNPQNSSYIEIP
jgi:hypothetical protein